MQNEHFGIFGKSGKMSANYDFDLTIIHPFAFGVSGI